MNRKNMMLRNKAIRNIPILGIALLLSGTSILAAPASEKASPSQITGETLYVGGAGSGNFSHIQDAVDNATNGDTVYVYDDASPYYEHVVVNNSISLIGEDANTTIIDGGGQGIVVVLTINASSTILQGFTVQNSGIKYNDSGIKIKANECTIRNHIIRNSTGINILGQRNTITGSAFYDNTGDSVLIENDWNTLCFNEFTANIVGIEVKSYHNEIHDNHFENNWDAIDVIGMMVSTDPILFLKGESQNDIYGNTIINNKNGIMIFHYWDTNVFENIISGCDYCAIFLTASWLGSTGLNNIYQNIITDNMYGIYLSAEGEYSFVEKNNISRNNISHNKVGLIFFCNESEARGPVVGYNIITRNNISYNDQGVTIFQHGRGRVKKNLFAQNNFIGNARHAYDEGWNIWYNATKRRGNYWDDYKGRDLLPPYGVGDKRYVVGPRWFLNKDKYPLMKPYHTTFGDPARLLTIPNTWILP
jgi:parallel beta-helix repeat protein